jgi:hypothetical protein
MSLKYVVCASMGDCDEAGVMINIFVLYFGNGWCKLRSVPVTLKQVFRGLSQALLQSFGMVLCSTQ